MHIFRAISLIVSCAFLTLPAHASEAFFQTPEDHSVALLQSTIFPAGLPSPMTVAEAPSYGQVTSVAGALHYPPTPGCVGLDVLTVMQQTGGSPKEPKVDYSMVTIRVVPRAVPATTRGATDGDLSPGFYDTVDRFFEFCSPWFPPNGHLECSRFDVPEADIGWIPATGKWSDGDLSFPLLFDANSGTLYWLERSGPWELKIYGSLLLPQTIGSWPVLGDWQGDGQTTPAFVDADGTVRVLSFETGTITAVLPSLLEVPSGQPLPWPAVWPVDGRDTVAWIDSVRDELHWRYIGSPTEIRSVIEDLVPNGRRLPITSDVLEWSGYDGALLFFEPSALAGVEYHLGWYRVLDGSIPSPSTLPLKFPHEPPGI